MRPLVPPGHVHLMVFSAAFYVASAGQWQQPWGRMVGAEEVLMVGAEEVQMVVAAAVPMAAGVVSP